MKKITNWKELEKIEARIEEENWKMVENGKEVEDVEDLFWLYDEELILKEDKANKTYTVKNWER